MIQDPAHHLAAIHAAATALLMHAEPLDAQQRTFIEHIARTSAQLETLVAGLPPTEAAWQQVIPVLGETFSKPQAALFGYARMLLEHPAQFGSAPPTEWQQAQLETIYQHGIALAQTTETLKQNAFAARQARRQQPAAAFDLVSLLWQQAPLYQFWLKPYPVRLHFGLDAMLPPAYGRPYHVDELIRHTLVTMASELVEYGDLRLGVEADMIQKHVSVSIFCTGIQLTSQEIATLYQKQGRHLYEKHLQEDGGSLDYQREAGHGASVIVHLQVAYPAL
ncbi:hypothetical protein G4Y79_21915 [Phototrophicus methaneseepsis]|uniref:Uncharacterized protein n=1 Tax=Phototrophicus methaneseepsis TaxID=2710758 RepID=A0A7S8E8P9_9CHLR|nr:hypothetical protein [Phototrophicus methaneseepsis]QPC82309.1 hypothetical protein G4Y79_21915 [Phototrophicus methaneseepsis]